jgi:hypothetical protein
VHDRGIEVRFPVEEGHISVVHNFHSSGKQQASFSAGITDSFSMERNRPRRETVKLFLSVKNVKNIDA